MHAQTNSYLCNKIEPHVWPVNTLDAAIMASKKSIMEFQKVNGDCKHVCRMQHWNYHLAFFSEGKYVSNVISVTSENFGSSLVGIQHFMQWKTYCSWAISQRKKKYFCHHWNKVQYSPTHGACTLKIIITILVPQTWAVNKRLHTYSSHQFAFASDEQLSSWDRQLNPQHSQRCSTKIMLY